MTGKTNAPNKSLDRFEFECTSWQAQGNWFNTNIPIAGVSKIVLQYYTLTPSLNTVVAELDTVSNGVLTKVYAMNSVAAGKNFNTSLKVINGMINFGQPVHGGHERAHVFMTVYH